jgi:hypothetical protein
MRLARARLLFHGAIVLLLSMLTGFPLFTAAQRGDQDLVQFWRGVHVGLSVVALWSIATGAVLEHLVLDDRRMRVLAWSLTCSNYAIAVSILIRALVGPSQMEGAAPVFRWLSVSMRNLSAVTALVAGLVTVRGGLFAVRAAKVRTAG